MTWLTSLYQDKTYQGYVADVDNLRRERDDFKSKIRLKLRDLMTINLMEDVMLDKQGDAECVSDKHEKLLRRVTGNSSDVYWDVYSRAAQITFDMMLSLSVDIANLKVSLDLCKQRIKEAEQAKSEYSDKFHEKFIKEANK